MCIEVDEQIYNSMLIFQNLSPIQSINITYDKLRDYCIIFF